MKTKFYHTIKFKIVLIIVFICVTLATAIDFYTIHSSKLNYEKVTWNYMSDMALAYGRQVDEQIEQLGDEGLSPDRLHRILEGVGIEGVDSSYVYIVDQDGIMLYHPTADKIGNKVENSVVSGLVTDLKSGIIHDTHTVDYVYGGAVKYASCYTNSEGRFILVVSADKDDVMSSFTDIISKSIGIAVGIGLVVICAVFFIVSSMFSPLTYAVSSVEALSELEFKVADEDKEKRYSRKKDEAGNILNAVVALRGKLTDVVLDLKKQSRVLFDQSESLSNSASGTMDNMKDTERAVDEMANGATMLAEETQNASIGVVEIGNMIDAVNDNTEELSKEADSMKALGEDAEKILSDLAGGQKRMVEHIGVVYDKTRETNEAAGKISAVVELISEIASQTDLLSLNASIEAARAGEAGRGFAVVAENIKNLAEQTTASATDIQNIIQELENKSTEMVEKTDAVKSIVDKQESDMQKTAEILGKVIQNVIGLIDRIDNIAASVENMDKAKARVVDVIQNLSAVSEENAASTQETSASTTMAMGTIESIAQEAVALKEIAQDLENNMQQFHLE